MDFKTWLKERETHKAAAMAVVYEGRVLILHRGPTAPWMPNKWNLPGGDVEKNESPHDAAMRECKEEAGIVPKNVRALRTFRAPDYILDIFTGEVLTDAVKINWESQSYAWVTPDKINHYGYVPFTKEVLKQIFSSHHDIRSPSPL